jgi:hypothetical protein
MAAEDGFNEQKNQNSASLTTPGMRFSGTVAAWAPS